MHSIFTQQKNICVNCRGAGWPLDKQEWPLDLSPNGIVGVINVEDCEEADDGQVHYDIASQCQVTGTPMYL